MPNHPQMVSLVQPLRSVLYGDRKIPRDLLQDLIENPNRFGLPKVNSVVPAPGGVVHHVSAIETDNARFYAKIRTDRLSGVPEIQCDPHDVQFEAKALSLFRNIAPDLFPEIVYCDPYQGILILTDVVQEGWILEDMLLNGGMTSYIAHQLGETVRVLHDRARSVTIEIHGAQERTFARTKLEHKLGPTHHPSNESVMRRLQSDVQLIVGDLSPKNIAYHSAGERFTFFDLEDSHHGHPSFDVGFVVGHLLLHNYLNSSAAECYVSSFLRGYGQQGFQDLAQIVAASTFHYRLNGIIPYCVSPSEVHRAHLLKNASAMLNRLSVTPIPWDELIFGLLNLTRE